MGIVKNPILSGFYPDPSVCAVDTVTEDGSKKRVYYLVNSTFCYTPGVPIFYSEDLCEWTQIGHVLTKETQLNLDGLAMSKGIYAPTIRYHKGTFYMITTNVMGGGNFYVTATDPAGEWSEPVYLPDAEGIDPSLFFDGDTCYYVGQRNKKDGEYFGDCEIWIQELDLKQGKLVGEIHSLWDGAMKHAIWPEGPHLYKKDDYYYLMIAEGGTAYEHSICVARSKELFGPYESYRSNPVFTHRHLGHGMEIQNTGHGDLVEDADGNWYIFMLATRPVKDCAPLGRETFVAEVKWEEDWPVINPGVGQLRKYQPVGNMTEAEYEKAMKTFADNEDSLRVEVISLPWTDPLDKKCVFFRYPQEGMYKIETLSNGKTALGLLLSENTFEDEKAPSYIGVRVTDMNFALSTNVSVDNADDAEAGLVYLHDEQNYVKWVLQKENGVSNISLIHVEDGVAKVLYCKKAAKENPDLKLGLKDMMLYAFADGECIDVIVDACDLTSERKGGFTGCTIGVYAATAKKGSDTYALFSDTKIER